VSYYNDSAEIMRLRRTLAERSEEITNLKERTKVTRLRISTEGDQFMVDDPSLTGSPPVGRGKTMIEAIGSFVHNNQDRFGFVFDVDPSAEHAEEERRERELARR